MTAEQHRKHISRKKPLPVPAVRNPDSRVRKATSNSLLEFQEEYPWRAEELRATHLSTLSGRS